MSNIEISWPTLGILGADWIEAHCPVPDGFGKGKPFVMYDWQLESTLNHYRVKPRAKLGDLAPAFHNRRSQIVGPQKYGKGPWSATIVLLEGLGPAVFAGWAGKDDGYACSDHGCGCGFEFPYEPGEPMGRHWPTPLIQLMATSEDQVDNVYGRSLQPMVVNGPLADRCKVGEEFTRLPDGGRIDVVTSSALSRLGQPIVFALQDETGLYTKTNKLVGVAETQRRNAAGMGGRTIETTNAWDPTQNSTAQRTAAAAESRRDIFRHHPLPPSKLKYKVKADRAKIHRAVYRGCGHVDLRSIEAEAAELIIEDPGQAERFYGNRAVAGQAKWATPEEFAARIADPTITVKKGTKITLGFDGSDGTRDGQKRVADSSVLRACRLSDGYRWTIGAWEHERNPDGSPVEEWFVPRAEVLAKIAETFERFEVVLAGLDPPYWRSEIAGLIEAYGDDRIIEFRTANDHLMAGALQRLKLADTKHDGDPDDPVAKHWVNAVKIVKEYRDDNDERKTIVLVSKESKDSPDKIDGLISDAIANDMRDRAIAAGERNAEVATLVAFR